MVNVTFSPTRTGWSFDRYGSGVSALSGYFVSRKLRLEPSSRYTPSASMRSSSAWYAAPVSASPLRPLTVGLRNGLFDAASPISPYLFVLYTSETV